MNTTPDPKDDFTGCMAALEAQHGPEWVFHLIGAIRDHRGPGPAGEVRTRIARDLVAEQMRTTPDRDEARRIVAERLGYGPLTRTNFYKIADGTTRTGKPIE